MDHTSAAIVGKLAIGVFCWAGAAVLARSAWWNGLSARGLRRWSAALLLASRLSVFFSLHVALDYLVDTDAQVAYYPEAASALEGKLPDREIRTTYAPLFPYLAAAALAIWRSYKSIVLLAIVFEAAGFFVWYRVLERIVEPEVLRKSLLLYLASPLLISTVALAGQNHVWISPFFALAVYAVVRDKDWQAGVWSGLGLLATKFLAAFLLPGVLARSRRKALYLAGCLSLPAAVYGFLALAGADILYPLKFQRSAEEISGGNLPYWLSALGAPMNSSAYLAVAAVLLIAAAALLLAGRWVPRDSDRMPLFAGVFFFALTLLLNKKAYTTYWAAAFFPLAATWVFRAGKGWNWLHAFQFWGLAATLEPTLYYRWMLTGDLSRAWRATLRPALQPLQWAAFLLCEAVVAAFLGIFLWRAAMAAHGETAAPAGKSS